MANINSVVVSGRLTKAPELRATKSGTAVAHFSLAYNYSRKTDDGSYKDDTSFFDVTVWGNFAELIARKLQKADAVTVAGRLDQESWETEDGNTRHKVVIIANQIDGNGMYRSKDDENAGGGSFEAPTAAAPAPVETPTEDDIPFRIPSAL